MAPTPLILAEGQPCHRTYQHVGYEVGGHDAFDVVRVEPATQGAVLAGLVLFAGALLLRRLDGRLRFGLVAASVVLWGAGLHWAGNSRYVPEAGTIEGLLQIERLAAATEAQAVALGRWPTEIEWHQAHGHPVGRKGMPIGYGVGMEPPPASREPADKPWHAYAVWCGPAQLDLEHTGHQPVWLDSRLFGADGLFGTPDDDRQLNFLRPAFYHRVDWPHARAPRDPNVQLPPPPRSTP